MTKFEHTHEKIGNKPVTLIVRKILNLQSGFSEKLLCDGPTFTAGDGCVYSCAFCYTGAMGTTTGIVSDHMASVVRRKNAETVLLSQLTIKGKPKFTDPTDKRVVYSSPLVDVAATVELAKETIELCKIILSNTSWEIRLLSKSNLLPFIAKALPEYKERLIFGVSTGTPSDALAKAFEQGTALVSKRIQSLHWLQDNGFRTFGMICPSLPYATDSEYDDFSLEVVEKLRIDKCEHVWAEVINVRGESMELTCKALTSAGFSTEAKLLRQVSTSPTDWEEYARKTFLAHAKNIPASKLRFLQYVNNANVAWWLEKEPLGAVLLGKAKL